MSLQDYLYEKPVLETENLILRKMTGQDVDDLEEWMGDTSLYLYWGKRPGKSDRNPRLLFEKEEKPSKSFQWGIVHKKDGKVIGEFWVYLIENDRMAKVAFRLSQSYQGNRLMEEALKSVVDFCFHKTQLQRLWTDVHVENTASLKTLERVGFQREGRIRQGKLVNTYCDYYLYGILAEEWN